MDILINEILEQDPISESRITINENFEEVKSAILSISDSIQLDPQNGTLDLTATAIGTIKAKGITTGKAIFPTTGAAKVTINALNDGQIVALIGTIDAITSTNVTVSAKITAASARINGISELNGTVKLLKGFTKKREVVGNYTASTTKTISNEDNVLGVIFSSSGCTLTLAANSTDALSDGHETTIINVGTAPFNIAVGNVVGYNTIMLSPGGKSSIILHYNLSLQKWYILASNAVTMS